MLSLEQIVGYALETVFPTQCVTCGVSGDWWCQSCRTQAEQVRRNLCPRCAKLDDGHECAQTITGLDALMAVGFYHDPKFRAVITSFKYKHATCVLPSLRTFLNSWSVEFRGEWPWQESSALAVQHLPATPSRVRQRGFDQADMIANLVRADLLPWATRTDFLERVESNTTQASLEHGPLRRANALGCFQLKSGVSIPEMIVLVDDVLTTGSTMNEAAQILRTAGAKQIYGFVLAVGA